MAAVVEAVHGRGAKVAAHSGRLNGAREAVIGGVDSIEHGFDLDAATAAEMAARGTTLVSTLAVMRSWLSFGATTSMERFAGAAGVAATAARLEQGEASVRTARDAGVAIATGSDFGGGSLRANQLAWEVTSLVAAGIEPVQALAAATWRGGELHRRGRCGRHPRGRPGRLLLRPRRPAVRPRRAVARVANRMGDRGLLGLDTGATLPAVACPTTGQSEERIMRSAVLRAFSIGTILTLLLAYPAAAFELNGGCTLEIASTDASGGPLDLASGPGAAGGGTQADPFLIDWDGTVSWVGSSGDQVFNNHSWQTYVFLVPTPVRGGDPNDDDDTTGDGTVGVGENAPFRITGLYYVSGTIDGEGGRTATAAAGSS